MIANKKRGQNMKSLKKMMALALAMVMVLAMSLPVFAASIKINSTADTDEAATETTAYTAWKLLDADIEDASKITVDKETGEFSGATTGDDVPKVAYYTTSSTAKAALEATGLFTFTQVGTENKWYATAKDGLTAAEVTAAFANKTEAEMTAAFGDPATGAQSTPGGSATINVSDPGYYYIKSTLGDEIAVQTLADVEINTKNSYPGDKKEVAEAGKHAQIGDTVEYTLTLNIPDSANDTIVLTDTMDEGLTFKEIDATFSSDVAYTFAPTATTGTVADAVTANGNKFTLTLDAATVKNNQGAELTITVKAVVNEKAVVGTPIKNKLDLKYGNNYTAVPKEVQTETHSFTFDKVDGSTKLTGAEFQLLDGTTPVKLIKVTDGVEYRVATAEEITAAGADLTDTIVTKGETITIKGVDSDTDHSYKLHETKAPAGGYNLLTEDKAVTVDAGNSTHVDVENNKGSVLPSTGGIGTTIFYIIGAILVIGAGVLLVTRRRMNAN